MIDADLDAGTRYRMLETLRAFGLDRLERRGRESAAGYLLRWAIALTGWIGATMTTEHEPDADAALRRELANLRAAWQMARAANLSTPRLDGHRVVRRGCLPRPGRDPFLGRGSGR